RGACACRAAQKIQSPASSVLRRRSDVVTRELVQADCRTAQGGSTDAAAGPSRGDGAGRSAQRGTSGAATGPGGRSAPDPEAWTTESPCAPDPEAPKLERLTSPCAGRSGP